MRAMQKVPVLAASLVLLLGVSAVAIVPPYGAEVLPVNGVTGMVVLDPPSSLGDFSHDERVFQYRDVRISGAPLVTNDARLNGQVDSTWNWDVHSSGSQPVPAWGTMRIEVPSVTFDDFGRISVSGDGAWDGTFTAIRRLDREPFSVRAFLFGQGAYDGLCATLDIEAGSSGWLVDGVVHRVPMAG